MTTEIQSIEPDFFFKGDTVKFKKYIDGHDPAVDTLTYYFVKTNDKQTIVATDNGDGYYLVEITAAVSDGFKPGVYTWGAKVVTASLEEYTHGFGQITVIDSLEAASAGLDLRSHAKKMLDAIELMLEGKATHDQLSYSIGGVAIGRMSPEEATNWRDYYRREYRDELNAARVASGRAKKNKILMRPRR